MTSTTPRAGRREWIGLAVLVLPVLLISMDMSVLLYAIPRLTEDLKPSGTQLLWIMDSYGFLLAGLLITMGTLGDRIGRRRLLLIGAAAFGAASVLAAFSTSAGMLIGARAVLGVGGATLMPSTLSLIRNMFHDTTQRRTAIAVWTGTMSGGVALGPLLGGMLLEHFWWGSVFLVNVPVMVLLLVLGPLLVPEFRVARPGRFDLLGAVLWLATVLPFVWGLKRLAAEGPGAPQFGAIVLGTVFGALFVLRLRHGAHPMIDVGLFVNRAFSASLIINVLAIFALVGSSLLTTQFLQLVLGMGPFTAALWSLPPAGAAVLGAVAAPLVARWVRPAVVVAAGLLAGGVGFALLTGVTRHTSLAHLLTAAGLWAFGISMTLVVTGDLILGSVSPERSGVASGLSETGTQFGGALGTAILGSIALAVYRRDVADNAPSLPSALGTAARDTLGGATEVASRLPGRTGGALLDAARDGFAHGLRVAAVAMAAVLVLAAVSAVLLLRRIPVATPTTGSGTDGTDAVAARSPRTPEGEREVIRR